MNPLYGKGSAWPADCPGCRRTPEATPGICGPESLLNNSRRLLRKDNEEGRHGKMAITPEELALRGNRNGSAGASTSVLWNK